MPESKIVTIGSQKGGVGKTTVVLNLGIGLGRMGWKVLLVDGDPQGGLGISCSRAKYHGPGLIEILMGKADKSQAVQELSDSIALCRIGSKAPNEILVYEKKAINGNLGRLIRDIASDFDCALVDTPAGTGTVTRAFLEISDRVVPVINCLAGTVRSMPRFIALTDWVKEKINPDLRLGGVVINIFTEKDPSEERICKYLQSRLHKDFFYNTIIPRDKAFDTAHTRAMPVSLLPEGKEASRHFEALAEEFIRRDAAMARTGPGTHATTTSAMHDEIKATDSSQAFQADPFEGLLSSICCQAGFNALVLADAMGFPISGHNSPTYVDEMAAFAPVLGDSLEKARAILGLDQAESIVLEASGGERLALRMFKMQEETYYLLARCQPGLDAESELELAVEKIKAVLS